MRKRNRTSFPLRNRNRDKKEAGKEGEKGEKTKRGLIRMWVLSLLCHCCHFFHFLSTAHFFVGFCHFSSFFRSLPFSCFSMSSPSSAQLHSSCTQQIYEIQLSLTSHLIWLSYFFCFLLPIFCLNFKTSYESFKFFTTNKVEICTVNSILLN